MQQMAKMLAAKFCMYTPVMLRRVVKVFFARLWKQTRKTSNEVTPTTLATFSSVTLNSDL